MDDRDEGYVVDEVRDWSINKHGGSDGQKTVIRHADRECVGDVVEDLFVWFSSTQQKSKLPAPEDEPPTSNVKKEYWKLYNADDEVSVRAENYEGNTDFIHVAMAMNLMSCRT